MPRRVSCRDGVAYGLVVVGGEGTGDEAGPEYIHVSATHTVTRPSHGPADLLPYHCMPRRVSCRDGVAYGLVVVGGEGTGDEAGPEYIHVSLTHSGAAKHASCALNSQHASQLGPPPIVRTMLGGPCCDGSVHVLGK